MFRFSDLQTGNKELNPPSRSGPPLSHAKSHSVKRSAKPSDTGESGLFRVFSSWMRYASLGLEYPQRQPKLVVFQAISDHGFKTVVIVIAEGKKTDLGTLTAKNFFSKSQIFVFRPLESAGGKK